MLKSSQYHTFHALFLRKRVYSLCGVKDLSRLYGSKLFEGYETSLLGSLSILWKQTESIQDMHTCIIACMPIVQEL